MKNDKLALRKMIMDKWKNEIDKKIAKTTFC